VRHATVSKADVVRESQEEAKGALQGLLRSSDIDRRSAGRV
jgi:hypothetical protein